MRGEGGREVSRKPKGSSRRRRSSSRRRRVDV
jgi:hypothetical protein